MSSTGDLISLSKNCNRHQFYLNVQFAPGHSAKFPFSLDEAFISLAPACPVELLENLAKRIILFSLFLPPRMEPNLGVLLRGL